MDSEFKTVRCPILNKEIDFSGTCIDICMVAEGTSPRSELPSGLDLTEERKNICMACKEHPDL